jgi:hypothetical protein
MNTSARPHPQQLPLLPVDDIPLQFRLDERTRRLGLAAVARIKAQLAEQNARMALRSNPAPFDQAA